MRTIMVMSFLLLAGCGIERPVASGLLTPEPEPDPEGDAVLVRDIILAADPQGQIPMAAPLHGPPSDLSLVRQAETALSNGNVDAARQAIAELRARYQERVHIDDRRNP